MSGEKYIGLLKSTGTLIFKNLIISMFGWLRFAKSISTIGKMSVIRGGLYRNCRLRSC